MSLLLSDIGVERNDASSPVRARLRVLHLINSFHIGGTERQAVELLKRLDRERYDVRLAALSCAGPLFAEIAPLFPVVPEFPLTAFYNANALRQARRLRALLREERIDILHTHDFYAGLLGATAAQLTATRVLAARRHLRLSDRRIHAWGSRAINRLAARILVNAETTRDYVLTREHVDPRKLVLIRNGVSLAHVAPDDGAARAELLGELGLPAETKLIGMIANFHPVKGHRYVLAAAAEVTRRRPDAHFVLIGDGECRSEIEAQIDQLNLGAHVHLLGRRDHAARLVAGFDLALLASLHEGMPNAVMEAMAAGVPVVSTAVGGARELIADNITGWLVPPADAAALAERIEGALADDVQRAQIGAQARASVLEHYHPQRMVEAVERLYEELHAGGVP